MENTSNNFQELSVVIDSLAAELLIDPAEIKPDMRLGSLGMNGDHSIDSEMDLLSLSHRIEDRVHFSPGTQKRVEFLAGSKNPNVADLTVESIAENIRKAMTPSVNAADSEQKEAA